MDKQTFDKINNYALSYIGDSAHDTEHVKRVLLLALKIAKKEKNVDYDVLIAAALLHDIGRDAQKNDKKVCHAKFGSELAYNFIKDIGWSEEKAQKVRECVLTHRFRTNLKPKSIEAKIIFDSDKIDVMGSLGVARSFMFIGSENSLMYSLDENGEISNTKHAKEDSFLREYHKKLKNLDEVVYTKAGKKIAKKRKNAMQKYYKTLLEEINQCYKERELLIKLLK